MRSLRLLGVRGCIDNRARGRSAFPEGRRCGVFDLSSDEDRRRPGVPEDRRCGEVDASSEASDWSEEFARGLPLFEWSASSSSSS